MRAGCLGAAIILEPEPSELVSAKYVTWGIFVSNTGSTTVPWSVGGILDGEMIGFAFLDTDLFSYKKVNELSFNALCNALIA